MDQFPTKKRRFRQHITPVEQVAPARVLGRILTPEQRAELRDLAREVLGEVQPSSTPKNTRDQEASGGR